MVPCSRSIRRFSLFALICLVVSLVPPGATAARPVSPVSAQPPTEFVPDSGPAVTAAPSSTDEASRPVAEPTTPQLDLAQLPLSFVPNVGQSEQEVQFQAQGSGGALFFTPDEIVVSLPHTTMAEPEPEPALARTSDQIDLQADLSLSEPLTPTVVRLQFDGANATPQVRGIDPLPGVVNYFIGDDPDQWHTDITTYAGIVYEDLYPGIDLRYEGTDGLVKGTYVLDPGVDSSQIQWSYAGAQGAHVDDTTGDLVLDLPDPPVGSLADHDADQEHTLLEQAPIAWQEIDGQQVPVDVRYELADADRISFVLGDYDLAQPLIIDPTLEYSTYLGGSSDDESADIAVDADGAVYVTGRTRSSDFTPAAAGDPPYQDSLVGLAGWHDVFIAKIAPSGDQLSYRTYLGGSRSDYPTALALDNAGNVYVTGGTNSDDFPEASSWGGNFDAFVVSLNATGSMLRYSRYLGGSNEDEGRGIAVDHAGNAHITGGTNSDDFPEASSRGSSYDAFVVSLNATGSALRYSRYLGGSGYETGHSIALDHMGHAYITGETDSDDFPGASDYGGGSDAFVTALTNDGQTLRYSLYLGSYGDEYGIDIAVAANGNVSVVGNTDTPVSPGVETGGDVFLITVQGATGTHVATSYLRGADGDWVGGVAVDAQGRITVSGTTESEGFPLENPLDATLGGYQDAFVATFSPTAGQPLRFSTYLGGSDEDEASSVAVDAAGNVYVTGTTFSSDLVPGETPSGSVDAFVAKISTGTTEQPPLDVRITDTEGNDVSELALNDDGWPALNAATNAIANPITVTVTLTNTTERLITYFQELSIGTSGGDARFYIFDSPDAPQCLSFIDRFSETHSIDFCEAELAPNESQTFSWGVWVQPSITATLNVSAELTEATGVTPIAQEEQSLLVPQAKIHPVVFVHGILGSMPPNDELITSRSRARTVFDPFIGSYWPLLDNLAKMGYVWNESLFGLTYDWRQSNRVSGAFLGEQLDSQIIPRSNAPAVGYVEKSGEADLIVHSMGGLVSRSYIQGFAEDESGTAKPYNDDVRKVIFIATPHQGFPFNYRTWEGMTWHDYLYNAPRRSGGLLLSSLTDRLVWPTLVSKRYDTTTAELDSNCTWRPYANSDDIVELVDEQTVIPGRRTAILGAYICPPNAIAGWAHGVDPSTPGAVSDRARAAWSLNEMLPTDGLPVYLVNDDGIPLNPRDWPWGFEANSLLPDLNASIGSGLGTNLGVDNIYVLYGEGAPETDQRYEVDPPLGNNLWRYGKVTDEVTVLDSGDLGIVDGDDLIPTNSTTLLESGLLTIPRENEVELDATLPDGARHKEIVYQTETQKLWIPRFLGAIGATSTLPFETDYVEPLVNARSGVSVITSCPINLLITDPQGRRLGYDADTGQILREIPNAVYTSPNLEPQIIFIADPLPGTYTITSTGYESGDYLIRADQIAGDAVNLREIFVGETADGQQDTFTVTYDPDIPAVSPAPDQRTEVGVATDIDLGGFRAPDTTGPWDVEVDWGDGTSPLSFTTSVTGTLGTQQHTYASSGSYRVVVQVTDTRGEIGAAAFQVDVTDPSGGATTFFSDAFDRPDSASVGNNWVETEPSGTSVAVVDERMCFVQMGGAVNRPMVTNDFTAVTTGTLRWDFTFDWARTGTEQSYTLYMQLGDGSQMDPDDPDTGVGVNLVWTRLNDIHETLGARQNDTNTALTTLSGPAVVTVEANMDTQTFTVQVNGTTIQTQIPFAADVDLDTVRFLSHSMLDANFAERCFDDVTIARSMSTDPGTPGAFLESNGSVVLEAENATDILPGSGVAATHTWTTNNTFAGFTGTGAMRALPADGTNTGTPDAVGPRLRYAITFQTPGDYYVYVRGFAPQADQDSVHVGLDGTAVTTGGGSGLTGFPTTDYTWQNQHNNSATVISIPTAGTYTFDVWMREAGMVVDKLWLSTTPDVIANDSTAAGPLESPRSTSP